MTAGTVMVDGEARVLELEPAEPASERGARREAVVRRLLARGLRPETLRVILPDWGPLIERCARG